MNPPICVNNICVPNRKQTFSFSIAGSILAIAPLWLMLAAYTSANAQPVKSFGPTSVPADSVIFGPDNVLSAAELAELSSCCGPDPGHAVPAVKAMSFSPAPGQVFELSATGLVTCCDTSTNPYTGPEGLGYESNISSLGSISGYAGPAFALVGVFTNGSPSGSPPADYSYGGGTAPATFSPQLNQVFFIGDGINSNSGSPQRFIVPANATELWLGFADAIDFTGPPAAYGDNVGSLIVSGTLFQSSPSLAADLFLRIQPSATAIHQGDLLTYAFPVWNLGADNAVHEVLKTQVPEGTTFDYIRISGTPELGTCTAPPYQGTGEIVCDENSAMAPNTTWTVRLTVKVTAPTGTVITENATATEETPDPNLANNTATVSTTVQ